MSELLHKSRDRDPMMQLRHRYFKKANPLNAHPLDQDVMQHVLVMHR